MLNTFLDKIKNFNKKAKSPKETELALEPKMFPVQFRERSPINQRLYLFLIVVFYAIAVGTMAFSLLSGLGNNILNIFKDEIDLLILVMVVSLILLFVGGFVVFWTKNRQYLFTVIEFLIFLFGPLVYIVSYTYLSFNFTYTDPKSFLLFVAIISAVAPIGTWFLNLVRIIWLFNRYKNLFKKFLAISLGTIVFGATNLVLWTTISLESSFVFSTTVLISTIATLGAGLLFMIVGVLLSIKYEAEAQNNPWANVRFSGGITTLIIYAALFVIGLRFVDASFPLVVAIALIFNLIYLGVLLLYVFFRGRMKNLVKTNPIWNYLAIKLFIIFVLATSLILILYMEEISFLRSYSAPSFMILFLASLTIVIGSLIFHVTNMITFTKYFKTIIVGGFIALILILTTVFSIIILKHADIILAIIARQINVLFLIFALSLEVLGITINLTYTTLNIFNDLKQQNRKKAQKKNALAYKGVE